MKRVLLLVFLFGFAMFSPLAFAETVYEDANDVYENTEAFDGGPGSTINTSPDEYDGDADYSLPE